MDTPNDQLGVMSRYREGPGLLEDAVAGLQDPVLDAVPSAGGWTIRQIVHHVVDGDDIWKLCIKMAVGNEQAEFALAWYWSLPQQTWGDRWAYGRRSLQASLFLLKANRRHIVQLLESVPEAWDRAVAIRTRDGHVERMPVGFVVQMQADHLFHHVQRIRQIIMERAGA
jgi:uncharacterized damage-inducible protein DinB